MSCTVLKGDDYHYFIISIIRMSLSTGMRLHHRGLALPTRISLPLNHFPDDSI